MYTKEDLKAIVHKNYLLFELLNKCGFNRMCINGSKYNRTSTIHLQTLRGQSDYLKYVDNRGKIHRVTTSNYDIYSYSRTVLNSSLYYNLTYNVLGAAIFDVVVDNAKHGLAWKHQKFFKNGLDQALIDIDMNEPQCDVIEESKIVNWIYQEFLSNLHARYMLEF